MRRFFIAVCFCVLSAGTFASVEPATLVLEGNSLFEFKTRVGSVLPVDRVRLIQGRLQRLVDNPLLDLNQIKVQEEDNFGWKIYAGDDLLLVITAEDAKGEGKSGKAIAETIALRLKEIIAQDRHAKSPKEFLLHCLYAFLYTLGLYLLLFCMRRIYRRIYQLIETGQGTLIRSINIKTLEILPAERITQVLSGCMEASRVVLTIALLYFYVPLVLGLFPRTAQFSPLLLGYVTAPLQKMLSGLIAFIPGLFFIAVTALVTYYALKFIRVFFSAIEKGNLHFTGFYPEWAEPTFQLVRMLAIAFSFVVIFPYIPGSTSAAFQGVSVFLGILVSLGSSSAMSNVIAGLVLTYMRSFRIGDRVRIADSLGDVIEKSLLVTRIQTIKNVEVTIPNALVLSSHIINYSGSAMTKGLILHSDVTIGYDAPWRMVHRLLLDAALRTEGTLQEPAPFVLQNSLDDSYVRYQINVYTNQANHMCEIYSRLHANIQDAFNQAGVEIMSPSYSALRDGNTVTIPEENRSAEYKSPSFRVEHAKTTEPHQNQSQ